MTYPANHPTGAIKTTAELQNLIAKAIASQKPIALFAVSDDGQIETSYITHESNLFELSHPDAKHNRPKITLLHTFEDIEGKIRLPGLSIETYNIEAIDPNNRPHRLFTNLDNAEQYLDQLTATQADEADTDTHNRGSHITMTTSRHRNATQPHA